MNTSPLEEILLSAAEVAKAAGLEEFEIQNLHPDYFGVPGHWRLNKSSLVVYTVAGVEGLIDALEMKSNAAGAHSLRVALQQAKDKPSRRLAAPLPRPHWQDRADIMS